MSLARSDITLARLDHLITRMAIRRARGDRDLADDLLQEGRIALWRLTGDSCHSTDGRSVTTDDRLLTTAVRRRMTDFLRHWTRCTAERHHFHPAMTLRSAA